MYKMQVHYLAVRHIFDAEICSYCFQRQLNSGRILYIYLHLLLWIYR